MKMPQTQSLRTPQRRLCASLRSWHAHGHLTRAIFTRKMPRPKIGRHTFCKPAESTCTWTSQKSHFIREFTGKMLGIRWSSALALTVRTLQCGHTVWGKGRQQISPCWEFKLHQAGMGLGLGSFPICEALIAYSFTNTVVPEKKLQPCIKAPKAWGNMQMCMGQLGPGSTTCSQKQNGWPCQQKFNRNPNWIPTKEFVAKKIVAKRFATNSPLKFGRNSKEANPPKSRYTLDHCKW